MSLTATLAGAPFRTAVAASLVFVAVLGATGAVVHDRLRATMYGELEEQMIEEIVLLRDIYERGGQAALVRAVADTARPVVVESGSTALFGEAGARLAGGLSVAPDFVGWRSRGVVRPATGLAVDYRLRAERWTDTTLVVGRDTRVIDAALDALVDYLLLAGALVLAATLALGYLISRRRRDRLARMASVLERIGRGDERARMPVGEGTGQLERISRQMNDHLDALAATTLDARNTIRNIAHDLRTPLNRASVRLQELAATVDDRGLELVEAASAELDSLADIFETVLRIGRLRTAEGRAAFTIFALDDLVAEIAELYEPSAEAAAQRLVVEPAPGGPVRVRADRGMIAQLVANLVENALRHCPAGARIALGARSDPPGTAVLFVADDGPGVPAEARDAVLRPFVRLDASRTLPGSGLGLALVAAVARHHAVPLRLEDNEPGLRVEIEFERVTDRTPDTGHPSRWPTDTGRT